MRPGGRCRSAAPGGTDTAGGRDRERRREAAGGWARRFLLRTGPGGSRLAPRSPAPRCRRSPRGRARPAARSPEGSPGPACPGCQLQSRVLFTWLPLKPRGESRSCRAGRGSRTVGCGEPFCSLRELGQGHPCVPGHLQFGSQGFACLSPTNPFVHEPTKLTITAGLGWQRPWGQMLEHHKNQGFKQLIPPALASPLPPK